MQRIEVLDCLVRFSLPISELEARVAEIPWDSPVDLIVLLPTHVIDLLRRFESRQIDATTVESWANLVECRDDIGMSDAVRRVVFILANPLLEGPLTLAGAQELAATL